MPLSSTPVRFAGIREIQQNLIKAVLCRGMAMDCLRDKEQPKANHYAGMHDAFVYAATSDREFPKYLANSQRYNRQPVPINLNVIFLTSNVDQNLNVQDTLSIRDVLDPHHRLNYKQKPADLVESALGLAFKIKESAQELPSSGKTPAEDLKATVQTMDKLESPFLRSLIPWHREKETPPLE
jgi:hypothetical protein